jgi:hypothetical protein
MNLQEFMIHLFRRINTNTKLYIWKVSLYYRKELKPLDDKTDARTRLNWWWKKKFLYVFEKGAYYKFNIHYIFLDILFTFLIIMVLASLMSGNLITHDLLILFFLSSTNDLASISTILILLLLRITWNLEILKIH